MANDNATVLEELKLTRDNLIATMKRNAGASMVIMGGKQVTYSELVSQLRLVREEIAQYEQITNTGKSTNRARIRR